MPKTYLTIEERKVAEEDKLLRATMHDKIHRKISQEELAKRAGCSPTLVLKAIHHPEKIRISDLRRICSAAGIELTVTAD